MRLHTTMFARVLLAVPFVLSASCENPLDVNPTIQGVVSELTADPLMILVESSGQECGIWFLVDSETQVTAATSVGSPGTSSESLLEVGAKVSVWADGDLDLSCPAVGRALRVVVEM